MATLGSSLDHKVHPILRDMISRRAAEEGVTYRNNQNVLSVHEAFQFRDHRRLTTAALLPMAFR